MTSNTILDDYFEKSIKGTFFVFIGTIIGEIFNILSIILFANFFSTQEFGYFAIGITILDLCLFLGILGLHKALPQQISIYKSENKYKEIQSVIAFSLLLVIISGITIFSAIFFLSKFIVIRILNMPNFLFALIIFSLAIPFNLILLLLSSIFQGFQRIKEKILFSNIIKNLLFLMFMIFTIYYFW